MEGRKGEGKRRRKGIENRELKSGRRVGASSNGGSSGEAYSKSEGGSSRVW